MRYNELIQELKAFSGEIDIQYNEPMANHTTFRIGGPADIFLRPQSEQALAFSIKKINEYNIPFEVIGNGSNLLVNDMGYEGIIICTNYVRDIKVSENEIIAGAGVLLSKLARTALDNNLGGLEFAAGIPGTVGGGVFMNAGAYGGEIKDVLVSVNYCDKSGVIHTADLEELELGYRTSMFKKKSDFTITSAKIRLLNQEKEQIKSKMDEFALARTTKQPISMPSAGSTFKRPEGYFAAKLIDDSGLSGMTIGGAQVSTKHAGFVVNIGGATCDDVIKLMEQIEKIVFEKFGVKLTKEVRII